MSRSRIRASPMEPMLWRYDSTHFPNLIAEIFKHSLRWRFVGILSGTIGLLCYALSSSFQCLYGKWNLLKLILYSVVSLIISSIMLFPEKLQCSWFFRLKSHVAFLALILTSLYSVFYDKSVNGKPDVYSLVSNVAFALMSLSLSRQIQLGFESGLCNFFLGCFIVQLIKIDWILTSLVTGFCFSVISLLSCMDLKLKIGHVRDDDHFVIEIGTINEASTSMEVCGPPPKTKFTVGLLGHLKKLKTKFLAENASVVVLTGLEGSGKTTLAIEFCWDPEVRGKFGKNIFFLTFTKNPNLKNIIQKLFNHFGCKVMREFQSEEEAIDHLKILLQLIEGPELLVLDDVWPDSEYLVEKLSSQLSDCKILVTSRVMSSRFGTPYPLGPLCEQDALELFNHLALNDSSSFKPKKQIVQEVVRSCKGSPLALNLIGGLLCNQPSRAWLKRREFLKTHSILESGEQFGELLKEFLDNLEEMPFIKDCFMDLGLFPENQRIPVAALIDMWAELHDPDENGINAVSIVNELVTRNLANVVVTWNVASDANEYNYYNNHFVKLHDHDLAIYLSQQGPFEQRKRLIIDRNGKNRHQWWMDETQQGMISWIWSLFSEWFVEQKRQKVKACKLSITTDKAFTSDSCRLQPDEAEVLILNLYTANYAFPVFLKKMRKLKVLTVTNSGSLLSELNKFELLGSLSDLKRIRLEKVLVPSLCKLMNLQRLSLYMCKVNQAFQSHTIQISEALPNLVEISIDYCNDLVELPAGFCDIKPLKKLNITNCHMFSALPQNIGNLEHLEVLRLSSCTELEEMPASITRLSKLTFLDISDCIKLRKLPDDIGELRNLKKICMRMGAYSRLHKVPDSVVDLVELKQVVCDVETAALWEDLCLPNVMIEVPKIDNNLSWLWGGSS